MEVLGAKKMRSALSELALDLRWSWNHATDELWRRLDPELWRSTHNPWLILQTVSQATIERACADAGFCKELDQLIVRKRETENSPAWFQKAHPDVNLTPIAYFSMEFMLSEALPIYSGGLGNVAGDQLKAASDLGVPVVGVGLLYQQGYFRQEIDRNGFQRALYPFNDPGQLPIQPLRHPNGEWLRIPLHLPEATVWVRAWQAQVGRNKLYLLDTNDFANLPTHRGITSELYGGGAELRLQQEIVLGLVGWRLLQALGINPKVCHLNEGHSAFLVLERSLSYMREHNQPFDVALTVTRAGNVFTTHTPVAAGFDRFHPDLLRQYLGKYAEDELKIGFAELLALGRENPSDAAEPFNMAYLAIRGSGAVNGVSKLHGQVSRRLFQPLFRGWPQAEVPIESVTNGVHVPTWDSEDADRLWTTKCGEERWRGELESIGSVKNATDPELWQLRTKGRESLVAYARRRLSQQYSYRGASQREIAEAESTFHPDWLTIGFARRFATYKRPNLLLEDPDRLARILGNPERPAQLILAGKAHPDDHEGQAMIKQWSDFIARPDVRSRVAFLSDYDLSVTSHLVQGVDLWLNTPRRPWEACGTSGMKVLVNGGLNLSEVDGWWAEAYSPEFGWALGDGQEHADTVAWDHGEAEALYDLLEREVIPAFYTRDSGGIPTAWVGKMRASMLHLTPRFSSNRTVREYVKKYYLRAASQYSKRSEHESELGIRLSNWSKRIRELWSKIRFGETSSREVGNQYVFDVEVFLGDLEASAVKVELYAEANGEAGTTLQEMERRQEVDGGRAVYSCQIPRTRPASAYTPRIVPSMSGALLPLEQNNILWQH